MNCAALWEWLYWPVWRNEIPCRKKLRAKYGVLRVVQHQSNDCACVYIRSLLWTEHCFIWQSVGQHSKNCFIGESVGQQSKIVLSGSRWDGTPNNTNSKKKIVKKEPWFISSRLKNTISIVLICCHFFFCCSISHIIYHKNTIRCSGNST